MGLGEELWRGPFNCVQEVAPWGFREDFGTLCLGPVGSAVSPVLLVLGGYHCDQCCLMNDVWRSDDEGRRWELVSANDEGWKDERGSIMVRKWLQRKGFATAAAWKIRKGQLS